MRPFDPGSELHTVVHWTLTERDAIIEKLSRSNYTMLAMMEFTLSEDQITNTLDRFYAPLYSIHGDKGKAPFLLIVIIDEQPHYEVKELRGCKVHVNRNVYDFKHHLRKGRSAFLQASDNIEEAHSNIDALSIDASLAPYIYWQQWRPEFQTLQTVFSSLNIEQPLEYVVLRNFDGFFDEIAVDEHTDVDILTNDYMRMKANLGGIQYKTGVSSY